MLPFGTNSAMAKIGIIGGTGLDNPSLLQERQEKEVNTPYGKPSDKLILGKVGGVSCVLLARHGRKHDKSPTNVNYRANIWALKQEGCDCIIATNACGSLKEEIPPGDIVLLDQFIDRTTHRISTFYDGAETSPVGVCHIPMAQPFSSELRKILSETFEDLGLKNCHLKGTIVTIEGPRFSSKAESNVYRMYGGSVIGMTTVPEVILAKEAALPYATIALITDYDCWKDDEESNVNVDVVTKQMTKNSELALKILLKAIPVVAEYNWDPVKKAAEEVVKISTMLP